MTAQRRKELERSDRANKAVKAACDNANHPNHAEAERLAHRLVTDFGCNAMDLMKASSFWPAR